MTLRRVVGLLCELLLELLAESSRKIVTTKARPANNAVATRFFVQILILGCAPAVCLSGLGVCTARRHPSDAQPDSGANFALFRLDQHTVCCPVQLKVTPS